MSFMDFLFGGTDDSGLKWQTRVLNENIERVDGILNRSRDNAFDLFQKGDTRAAQGYNEAIDLMRQAPITQGTLLARGSQNAQQNLLSGMDEYRRAIMGLPSQFDGTQLRNNAPGLRPRATGSEAARTVFSDVQTPNFIGRDIDYYRRQAQAQRAAEQDQQPAQQPAQQAAAMQALAGFTPLQVPWGQIGGQMR